MAMIFEPYLGCYGSILSLDLVCCSWDYGLSIKWSSILNRMSGTCSNFQFILLKHITLICQHDKLPLVEIAVANCKHGHNFIEILHVSCTKASPIFSGWKICIHHWSLLSGIHTESAIAGYWLGSVMNHNRSEGKFLWFPPTNPSQENGKSPKFRTIITKWAKHCTFWNMS